MPHSQSRFYGVSVAGALCLLGWIAFRASESVAMFGAIAGIGVIYALVFYLVPSSQPKLINGFHRATQPLRFVMTLAVLATVYYAVLTPIAIWYRLTGKSIRQSDPNATTHWHPLESASDNESYFRTY